MLEVKNVCKSFGDVKALKDYSICVKKGEILGLVGSNGSGKSTSFRILLQLLKPDSGSITFEGKDLILCDKKDFGYLPEERTVFRDLSVRQQLYFLGRLKGMSDSLIEERLLYWAKRLEIEQNLDKKIRSLSKGNQQKVQFLGCLLHSPKVMILDEPFSGLDPYNLELMKHIFLEYAKQGAYVLLSTHRLDHIESFCSNVVLLDKGEIRLQGNIAQLRRQSDQRCITLMGDIPLHQIKDRLPYASVHKIGQQIRIILPNEKEALLFCKWVMKQYDVLSLQIEYPSLAELFLEGKEYGML
ncbi:MAG: ATP-binding cassette domain-containing protein [Erysipelotrichaceae bacterium]|nr:ATP-binding cassette domain-containing protein [Erysipelotrichaceae bacterium]